jgi:hypothetical protein
MRRLAVLPPLVAATLALSTGPFAGPAMAGSNSAADSQYIDPLAPSGTHNVQLTPRASRSAVTSSRPAAVYWAGGAAIVVLLAASGLVIHRRTGRA